MNINTVSLTGNLTKDPELKVFGETSVCKLRLAVNERAKENGEWVSKAMYFDVDVFGRTGESCAQYLTKGSHIALSGRLKWREWTTDDGGKRQAVSIIANDVEFPSKKEAEQAHGGGYSAGMASNAAPAATNAGGTDFNGKAFDPAADPEFEAGDEDIPF